MKELAVILVLVISSQDGYWREEEWPMANFGVCLKAVEAAQMQVSNGDENEQLAVLFCAYEED